MDPNANLREQETLLSDRKARGRYLAGDAARLLDLRQALYDWIRDGGFEPDWSIAPNARHYYGIEGWCPSRTDGGPCTPFQQGGQTCEYCGRDLR